MQKAVEPNSQPPQKSAKEAGRSQRQTHADGRSEGSLEQLAAMMNRSPQVQTQLKLAEEMQGSSQVQKQIGQAGEMNQQAPMAVQRKRLDEKKPGQMKSKLEEKKPMQGKFEVPIQEKRLEEKRPAQAKSIEKKKPVQGRFEDAATAQREEVSTSNRTGMPDQLKTGVESLSGMSLDDVKVHYNSDKPKQLNALAYAQGTDIHVGPGQEKHLPHEAWHIVQQKQGRVQPTVQMKVGVPVNDDPGLEEEADVMGARALQRRSNSKDRNANRTVVPIPSQKTP